LTSKGFDEVNRGDIYHFIVNGKKLAIHTMMSHGETYFGTKYLATTARQLGLERHELVSLVECPLSCWRASSATTADIDGHIV
jgi:hypothetical protein